MSSPAPLFELSETAAADLLEIWRYTYYTWSEIQADPYHNALEQTCVKIATGIIAAKSLNDLHPDLYYARCQRHLIFYMKRCPVLIFGFLHQKQDWLRHVEQRLAAL